MHCSFFIPSRTKEKSMAPLLLIGAALGGAAMYLFDPDRGRRRRALLRDQAVKATTNFRDVLDAGGRDLANRGTAAKGRLGSLFTRRAATNDVLIERVRSKLGRYTGHPRAIDVTASDGRVTLSGSVLRHEHDDLIYAVSDVAGVTDIVDQLTVHDSAEGVSELQGGRERLGELPELLQDNWSAGTRIAAGAAGTTMALSALRGGVVGLVLGATGALILLRSTTNKPLRRLAGMSGHRGIDIRKTIHIDAPIEQVFEFFGNYENFPIFMRNIRSVELRGNGQSHWTVAGPAGTTVEWDSVTTQLQPNQHIAWRTVPGSTVQHAGMIHFAPSNGGTRVHIEMSYNPPAGALGHVVAKLFGTDPKSELDEDLRLLKSNLERMRTSQRTTQRDASASAPA
jgi:uncharacterized membrane protein